MEGSVPIKKGDSPLSQSNNWRILTWGIFLILFLGSLLVAFGFPIGPITLAAAVLGLVFCYRYTYFSFYVGILLVMLLGITVSLSTGDLAIGQRAFGGSIDIFFGEIILWFVLVVWAVKVLLLWYKRRDTNWRPVLPLLAPFAALAAAHAISAFSSYGPDPVLVFKFVLRPVIFCYVAYIALPVNLIRSKRRLRAILGILTFVGLVAAANGLLSMASVEAVGSFVRRAHPIAIFGINPLGDNHNLLAELLLITAPASLALGALSKFPKARRFLYGAAALQALVALLTFARTAWIVFVLQLLCLSVTVWRHALRKHLTDLAAVILIMMPLVIYQIKFSFSNVAQNSNSARWMLTEIAWYSFLEHPLIGGGANTFIWRVGNARVFAQEFGDSLDAHGFAQKLMTETGSLGMLAYAYLLFSGVRHAIRGLRGLDEAVRLPAYSLAVAAGGAVIYQFFNTAYWTAHLWLPMGLLFAGLSVLSKSSGEAQQDDFERLSMG